MDDAPMAQPIPVDDDSGRQRNTLGRLAVQWAAMLVRLETLRAAAPGQGQLARLLDQLIEATRQLLQESAVLERRHRSLIEAVPDSVAVLDDSGRILDVNEAACRSLGYDRDALCTLSLFDISPARDPDHLRRFIESVPLGQTVRDETTNKRRDGTTFRAEVNTRTYLEDGQRRIVAVARDVTEKQQIEDDLRASEQRYQALLHSIDKGIIVQDERGRVISANPAACRMLGIDEPSLIELRDRADYWHVIDEHGRSMAFRDLPGVRALSEGRTVDSTVIGIFHRASNRYAWLSVTAVPQFRDGESRPFQVISMFSDVTALKRDSELFGQAQTLARIGGWEWIPGDDRVYWTRELFEMHELDVHSDMRLDDFLALFAEDDGENLRLALRHALEDLGSIDVECRLIAGRKRMRWVRLIGQALSLGEEAYRVAGTLQDITERKLREEALSHQASTDNLTGLLNRDSILQRLEDAIRSSPSGKGPTVLYVDLDRFKIINDLLGHQTGDNLLASAAERLRQAAGGDGEVARFGGDEFLVLVPGDSSGRRAEKLAERIAAAFTRPFSYAAEDFSITVSVGLARCPTDGNTAQELITSADTAMYEAKRRGRNTWQPFNASLARDVSERLLIEAHLRRALDQEEFRLVFQPQVDLSTGRVFGAEVLLRWRSRILGELPPDRFIQHAENTGDIVRIGAWVISESCRCLAAWRREGIHLPRLAVNLSFRQILSENLPEVVSRSLAEHGLNGSDLELEITERVLVDDAPDTAAVLRTLRNLGVTITIDDFGEGYSALEYLRRLPIQGLKISHRFLRGVPFETGDVAICQAIVGIAHSMGLGIIAEGVETEAQRAFLLRHGVRQGQGFMFSRPMEAPQLIQYLIERQNVAARA
jgi:diguanylate cyclase (GGDEF)-like protein/PAS domain S-box-containing protein